MRQHVHDNDLKALFFDFQHRLALKRYEEDDAAARSVVQALVLLCVLMPFDAEQQSLLHALAQQLLPRRGLCVVLRVATHYMHTIWPREEGVSDNRLERG